MHKFHLYLFVLWLAPLSLSASPIIVDSDNRIIGFYQGASEAAQEEHAVSALGYRFGFDRESGRVLRPEGILPGVQGQVFYTTTNCTGQAYLEANPGVKLGIVIAAAIPDYEDGDTPVGTPLLYYLAQAQRPPNVQVEIRSYWAFLGTGPDLLTCFNGIAPGQMRTALPVLPNSPSETGVPDNGFLPPLRILSSWLFRDGFETVSLTRRFGTANAKTNESPAQRVSSIA